MSLLRRLAGDAGWCRAVLQGTPALLWPDLSRHATAAPPSVTAQTATTAADGVLFTSRTMLALPDLQPRHFSTGSRSGREDGSQAAANGSGRHAPSPATALVNREVLYKGKGQRVFRVLVRMKIAQLTGVAAAAVPIATYTTEGVIPLVQLVAAGGLLVGCGAASLALWYYSSRYVGELSALPSDRIMISTMDFWGHRLDKVVHVLDVMPPLVDMSPEALQVMAERALHPLNVAGDQQYLISVRHGHLSNKARLMALLKGDWGREAQERAAMAAAAARRDSASVGSLGGGARRV